MVNEDRVKEFFQMAVFDQREEARYRQMGEYYMWDYVGKELVEMTRKMFPLSEKREDTYIGGISMGGYGALYNGMKYRDTFSKVAAFSPACDPYLMLVKEPGPGFSREQLLS